MNGAAADRLFDTAMLWRLRLDEPDAPASLQDEFLDWVGADPAHLAAYDRTGALWRAAGPAEDTPRDEDAIAALLRSQRRGTRTAAAGLAVALVAVLGLAYGPDGYDSLRADHIAWAGAPQAVTLADGSRVDLNGGAAMAVDGRHVTLFRGEAYFEVAPDPARPFVVTLPEGELRVTGTGFNVAIRDGAARVSLAHGGVTLAPRDAPGAALALAPGQESDLRRDGAAAPAAFDAELRLAWRDGRMNFYRAPLGEVIAAIGEQRRGRILLLNRAAAAMEVTGAFDATDTDAAIDIIARTLGLSVTRVAGMLTVLR